MRRLLALSVCALLLCCQSACRTVSPTPSSDTPGFTTSPTAPTAKTLHLTYNEDDTLDPFAATTQTNVYLSTLLYDPLVRPDANFAPMPILAKSITQQDATHLIVTLKTAAFSDGSAVTAKDVAFSFQKAKACTTYRAALSNFTAVTPGRGTVTFTLAAPDPHAAVCLYFPIIKQGSDTTASGQAAVGSGVYILQPDTATLVINPRHEEATTAKNRTIKLCHLVSDDAMLQNLESGSISYMFNNLSDGAIPRTTLRDVAVDLNQLVYIGINRSHPLLASAECRQALSAALDRTAIAASPYASRAVPATTPFHPNWKPAAGLTAFPSNENTDSVHSLLAAAQNNHTKPTGTATAATATTATAAAATATTAGTTVPLNFTLIYPSGNPCREAAVKLLQKQYAQSGITVTPTALSYTDYLARLTAGNYDLYLGEIALSPNMNLQIFFASGGAAAYGVNSAGPAAVAYAAYRSGETPINAFLTAFSEEMPYIPLCWRQGMAACDPAMTYMTPTAYAVFDGITNSGI